MVREFRIGRPGQKFLICDFETTGISDDADPIEVGIIECDEWFNIIGTYQSLIRTDYVDNFMWKPVAIAAYGIHKISPDIIAGAPHRYDVGLDIYKRFRSSGKDKPILVSDNIQFEWRFMDMLIRAASQPWPFHYCGWDSSLLLESVGINDPTPVHRALQDAGLLHSCILSALDRTRSLRKDGK